MATQNVCRYFKFGFCRYMDKCRFKHVKELCENHDCEVISCSLRHPKICRFYRDYNRCKFGEWCYFKHVEKIENSKEIFDKLKALEKLVEEKDSLITILANKIKIIEETIFVNKETDVAVTENLIVEAEIFKCDNCEFESNSKKGLHIHKKKKHAKQYKCDLCEEVFESETEGKMHRKTHSFKSRFVATKFEEQICENCSFKCKSIYTMEVHVGKCNTDNFECGLCDSKFKDLDSLELHLRTCEIYECAECYEKSRFLSEMKKHIREDHEETGLYLNNLKIDLENLSEVIAKSYLASDL